MKVLKNSWLVYPSFIKEPWEEQVKKERKKRNLNQNEKINSLIFNNQVIYQLDQSAQNGRQGYNTGMLVAMDNKVTFSVL